MDSTSLSRAQQRKIIGRAGGKRRRRPFEYNFFSYILEMNKSKFNGIGEEREERVTRVRHLENTSIIEHLG